MAAENKTDALTNAFVSEYMEKVFYFCLKKTGNEQDAQDLLSDISLNILSSFSRGSEPDNLPAYVWKTARNRYAVWSKDKHKRNSLIAPSDIGDYEIRDESADIENEWIRSEQLSLLRRELAFISSEYRDIVAAHYIKGIKTSELAASLGLPKGTVLTKLARARKILKEGMNMSREFGKRSYDPETLSFAASGYQPSGLPDKALERSISVNILCEANNNPCTVSDLALELGVAVPYMEEEVKSLVDAELLKKLDNGKYITSFFIAPKECENEINELSCVFAESHYKELWSFAKTALDKAVSNGTKIGPYSVNDAQMAFAFFCEHMFSLSVMPLNLIDKFHRADGGTWGLIGLESGSECRLPAAPFSNNGGGAEEPDGTGIEWWGYQLDALDEVFTESRYAYDTIGGYHLITAKKIAEGKKLDDLTEFERSTARYLVNDRFLVEKPDGEVAVNAIVFKDRDSTVDYWESLPEYEKIHNDYVQHFEDAKKIIQKYANPYLEDDFDYYVSMTTNMMRDIFARLWKDNGLYEGRSKQFCFIVY